jgi:hypothetical protein
VGVCFFETILSCIRSFSCFFSGMRFFPFASELYTLFFERVHATQLVVPRFLARPMFDACMHMWGS